MQNVLKNKYSSLVWMKSNRCHWQKNNCAMVNSVLLLQLLWQSFKLLLSCFIGTNTCMFRCPCLCAYILYSRRQVLCVYLCILSLYPSLIAVFKRELKAWEERRRHLIHVLSRTQLTALQVFSCCQWNRTVMRRDHPLMEKNSISVTGLIWILAFGFAFVAWLQHDAVKQRPYSILTQKGQFTDSWPQNVSDAFRSDCSLYFNPVA